MKADFGELKTFKSLMWIPQQKWCPQPLAPTIADFSPHMLNATTQFFSKRHSSPNPWRSFVLIGTFTLKKPFFPRFLAASTWRLLHRWHPSNGRQPRRQQHHPTSKALWASLTKNSYLSNVTNRKFAPENKHFAKTKRKFIDSNHWIPRLLLWVSRGVNALMEKGQTRLDKARSRFSIRDRYFSFLDSRFSIFGFRSRFSIRGSRIYTFDSRIWVFDCHFNFFSAPLTLTSMPEPVILSRQKWKAWRLGFATTDLLATCCEL